ncbi:MAG TPA: hypothetical protein VH275_09730 [Solirubrobacterales bacterium]|jgi:cobalamin synthase|nr:hypothetical protein [Solirubrobacterales bacterium]
MFLVANSVSSVTIPLVIGGFLGAIGSLIFILRARAFDKVEARGQTYARLSAVRRVLIIYAVIALLCFVVAIALGDIAFIVLTAIMAALACVGLVRFYGRRPSGSTGDPGDGSDVRSS